MRQRCDESRESRPLYCAHVERRAFHRTFYCFAVRIWAGSSIVRLESKGRVGTRKMFLASDAMRGRGSATPDEWTAAIYVASEFEEY